MRWRCSVAAVVLILLLGCGKTAPRPAPIEVYAAASLRDVTADLAEDFERRWPARVVYNTAGSNTLAQQIVAAPRADIFLSADSHWIDFLAAQGLIRRREPFLTNGLVVVAHREAGPELSGQRAPVELLTADYRFLAIADPAGVPAGRYARAYLERLEAPGGESLWSQVGERLVPALDVRAALALVESDPAILGIVYETDALASRRVRVLHEFAPLADQPITYWAATISNGARPGAANEFLDYLTGPNARQIIARHGFSPAGG